MAPRMTAETFDNKQQTGAATPTCAQGFATRSRLGLIDQGVINFPLQHEVVDTLTLLRSVRRQSFQRDGTRHGVHG